MANLKKLHNGRYTLIHMWIAYDAIDNSGDVGAAAAADAYLKR